MWNKLSEKQPDHLKPVVWKGDSGYRKPHDILLITGFYDTGYRPLSPVLNCQWDPVTDMAPQPTEWMYLDDLLKLTSKE